MWTNPSKKRKIEAENTLGELKSPRYGVKKMKTNSSTKKKMEAGKILEKLKSPRYGPSAKIKKNGYDWFDVTGDGRYMTNCDSIRIVINNNSLSDKCDESKIKRFRRAMELPCMHGINMDKLLANDPRLEEICADWQNNFFYLRYKSYRFNKGKARSDEELQKKVDDFKYLINLCGSHLKILNLEAYPFSKIMPFINTNCPNLNELKLQFKEIKDEDFKNIFSNMSHIEVLRINWQCEKLNLPLTLVESLEQVSGTLKELCLSRNQNQDHLCLPDSLASVFPQLITLKKLNIINFEPSQLLLQSISGIKNLVHLRFMCSWLNNDPVFDEKINMYPIGNLQNLETFYINFDCGVTDEFLINLCNNAKKLTHFDIIGKNITDNGMIALKKLKKLKLLKFNLNGLEKNEFITDQSIQCLVYKKLEYLDLSNCTKITNRSVLKLFQNLPNLYILYVRNTNITFKVARKMLELTRHHEKPLFVYVSFEDRDDIFKSLAQSDVFFKSNFNTRKYIDILV